MRDGTARQPGETKEQWIARLNVEWPETMKTLRIIQLINENQRKRGAW